MFTRAAPLINDNLVQGGLSPAQAGAVTGALGQCNAPLEHRGPVTIDYTSPNMQYIGPTIATYNYPTINMYPPEAFPPKPPSPPGLPPPEELPPWEPDPFPPGPPVDGPPGYYPPYPGAPSGGGGGGSISRTWLAGWIKWAEDALEAIRKYLENLVYEAGEYLDIDDANDTRRYYLKTSNDGDGKVCTFGTDEIVGKDFDELVNDHSDKILEVVKDENSGVPANQVSVLTSVALTASGLEFTQQTISVLEAGSSGAGPTIPVVDCP